MKNSTTEKPVQLLEIPQMGDKDTPTAKPLWRIAKAKCPQRISKFPGKVELNWHASCSLLSIDG